MAAALQSPPRQNALSSFHAGSCSSFVWTFIEGYEPLENCYTKDDQEVGWIRPRDLKKTTPESKWGTAADWPGQWQAIPHRYNDEGQPIDWDLSTYQPSYAAAKEWIERGWTNAEEQRTGC